MPSTGPSPTLQLRQRTRSVHGEDRLQEDARVCVQTLHIGSYDDETEILAGLHQYISNAGLRMIGRHHESYLSDFRKVEPSKLRTILRQPVDQE